MYFYKYNTIQNSKKGIKQLLNYLIVIFDHNNEYNSVGKPVNIEIFQ